MDTYLTLLCGIAILFSVEIKSASISKTTSGNFSTAGLRETSSQLTTLLVHHNETETRPTNWDPAPAHKPTEVTASTIIATSSTAETEGGVMSSQSESSHSDQPVLHTLTTATTAAEAQTFHNTIIPETAKPTVDQLQRLSPTTSTAVTAMNTPSAASSATELVSLQESTSTSVSLQESTSTPASLNESTSTARLTVSSESSANTLSDNSTSIVKSTLSSSTVTTLTTSAFISVRPLFGPTSPPVTVTKAADESAESSSTSQPTSASRTSIFVPTLPGETRSSTAAESSTATDSSHSSFSTSATTASPVGILISRFPKKSPIPSTRSPPGNTPAPCGVSRSPASTGPNTCSAFGVVKHCLIAIASLAVLATIFIVSTIILCTKLSARKYRVRKPQQSTEMMCISSLLPDRNYAYTRQRSPVPNGVLVIPSGGDSEDEIGDNVTLSSFLPENDRYV